MHTTDLGDGTVHRTTTTGTVTFVANDPSQASFRGHLAESSSVIENPRNATSTNAENVVVRGSDGSLGKQHLLIHHTLNANGTVTSWIEIVEFSCLAQQGRPNGQRDEQACCLQRCHRAASSDQSKGSRTLAGHCLQPAVASLLLEPPGLSHSFFAGDGVITWRFVARHNPRPRRHAVGHADLLGDEGVWSVILEGGGMGEVVVPLLVMAGFGVAFTAMTAARFGSDVLERARQGGPGGAAPAGGTTAPGPIADFWQSHPTPAGRGRLLRDARAATGR